MNVENTEITEDLEDGAIVTESEPRDQSLTEPATEVVQAVAEEPPPDLTEKSRNRFHTLAQERDFWKRKAAEMSSQLEGKAEPRLEDYDHDIERYTAAAVEHAANTATVKGVKATADVATERMQKELVSAFANVAKDATTRYPDFDKVFDSTVPVTSEMGEAIVMSSRPTEIAYYLGANRDVAAQIANLPPHLQGYEVARLEAKISTAPIQSKAPTPPTVRVSGASASGAKRYEDMDDAEYERTRAKERAEYRARHY